MLPRDQNFSKTSSKFKLLEMDPNVNSIVEAKQISNLAILGPMKKNHKTITF